jgi:hypothetical protein
MFANCYRRFGIELEYNAFDNQSRSRSENDLPSGIYDLALYLKEASNTNIEVSKWSYTNNNSNWVLKPDSSCGIEVCTPPFRGYHGHKKFTDVLGKFLIHDKIKSDSRCSMHVHVEIEDFTLDNIAFMVEKWINFELFFFLLTASNRWLNQYCVPLGMSKEFSCEETLSLQTVLNNLADYKYYSINLYHYMKNRKKTIEFRCMGNDACVNVDDASNWTKVLLCFVDNCSGKKLLDPLRIQYEKPSDAIEFLNIENYFKDNQVKLWIISKLNQSLNVLESKKLHFWNSILDIFHDDILHTINKMEQSLK